MNSESQNDYFQENWADFVKGVQEFNGGQYFEAHDSWEELWRYSPDKYRQFYQGLIHATVGLFHASGENYAGALSQVNKCLEKLKSSPPGSSSINIDRFLSAISKASQNVEAICFAEIKIEIRAL